MLTSIEYPRRPAVFGSTAPPSGLSGRVRRLAFRFSESRWSHWLLLMLADRINVAEGVLGDLGRGRLPDLVEEFGLKARWKSAVPSSRAAAAVLVGGGLLVSAYLIARRRDSRFLEA